MALKRSPDDDGLCRLETLHAFVPSYSSLRQSMHIDLSAVVHFTGEGQMGGFVLSKASVNMVADR